MHLLLFFFTIFMGIQITSVTQETIKKLDEIASKKYKKCIENELIGKEVPKTIVDKLKFNSDEPLEKGDLFAIEISDSYLYACFGGTYSTKQRPGTNQIIPNYSRPNFFYKGKKGNLLGSVNNKSNYAKIPYELLLIDFVKKGNLNDAMILVDQGANVNATDDDHRTTLMYATLKGDYPMVKFLLDHGADTDIADVENHRALEIAFPRRESSKDHEKVYKLLIEKEEKKFKERRLNL